MYNVQPQRCTCIIDVKGYVETSDLHIYDSSKVMQEGNSMVIVCINTFTEYMYHQESSLCILEQ